MTVKQRVVPMNGGQAVAYAVKQVNPEVVAAYPITPQTIIVEDFSQYVADGEVDTEFLNVESEHSALSCCIGASLCGARTFTASASQGIALMHEVLFIASGLRCPIVMAVANRSLSAPINIHCDHSDSIASRDASWIQFYVEDVQEAYDTIIQAYRIAEHPKVQLPVMVMLDGFVLSHTTSRVELLPDNLVSRFSRKRKCVNSRTMGREVPYRLDTENPLTIGSLVLFDYYFEIKRRQEESMRGSIDIIKAVNDGFEKISGRSYGDGLLEVHGGEDADTAIICMGSTAGTARAVLGGGPEKAKAAVVRLRSFRPFPDREIVRAVRQFKAVGILDRSAPSGAKGGPLFNEIRSALYDTTERPFLVNYIYGLGGRDVPETAIEKIFSDLRDVAQRGVKETVKFVGLRQ
ncbi:MAG: pyruvate ferredoxin oxidoreductase [Candidatus Bathyarchaeia archaeon]